MSTPTLRRWVFVHRWSSLVSTIFLLLLCVTGLPLIFRGEIEQAIGAQEEAPVLPANSGHASVDRIIAVGHAARPGEFVQFAVWERDETDVVILSMAPSPTATPENNKNVRVDARTAEVLEGETQPALTQFLLRLHTELFAGMAGKLFLGVMGLMFLAAIVSGV